MDDKGTSVKKEVEDTLACTAYAEAGEPCPIGGKKDGDTTQKTATKTVSDKKDKSVLDSVEDTLACTAYAESGEPCPIDDEKKPDK